MFMMKKREVYIIVYTHIWPFLFLLFFRASNYISCSPKNFFLHHHLCTGHGLGVLNAKVESNKGKRGGGTTDERR